jgi:hypothetical protein
MMAKSLIKNELHTDTLYVRAPRDMIQLIPKQGTGYMQLLGRGTGYKQFLSMVDMMHAIA